MFDVAVRTITPIPVDLTSYKPCPNCNAKNHFGYLCLTRKGKVKVDTLNTMHVNANCLTLGSGHSEDVVLPTFSITMDNEFTMRVLKDTGCTNCFIKRSLAKSLNCKVLKRIKVSINGMNINSASQRGTGS